MTNNNQKTFIKQHLLSSLDVFNSQLSNRILVDFGILQSLDADGIAIVRTFRTSNTGDNLDVRAELVSSSLLRPAGGQICLLVYPRTPIYSFAEQSVYQDSQDYDKRACKCIPLEYYGEGFDVAFSRIGDTLVLAGSEWNLKCSPTQILLDTKLADITISDTQFSIDTGKFCAEVDSLGNWVQGAGYEYDKTNRLFNWKSRIKQNTDGSIIIEGAGQKDSSNQSLGKNKILLDTDGNITIQAGISTEGEAASEIVVGADGSISITNSSSYEIVGNGVSIDGTDGKISIKNSSYSMADLFNDLIDVLDNFQTAGSPANHKAVPQQFQQIQQKLADFLE